MFPFFFTLCTAKKLLGVGEGEVVVHRIKYLHCTKTADILCMHSPDLYGPDNNANTDITSCHVWSIEDNNLRLFLSSF